MPVIKKLSLGSIAKLLGTLTVAIVVGGLLLAACSNFSIGGLGASKGIPTQAPAAAAAAAVAPPPAPTNTTAAAAPANPPAPAPAAPAAVPTVQPAIVNDAGEVIIAVPGDQQPAVRNAPQQQDGISPAPVAQPGADLVCGQRVTHVVQPGETLFRIATRYNSSAWSIARINRIANVRRVSVGKQLVIVTCDKRGGVVSGGGGRRYVVQAGDTLFRIGVRYGTTAERIRLSNGLAGYGIWPGQVLVIP